MVTFRTDTGAVIGLGGDIVAKAASVDGAAGQVAGTPCLAGPPETAAALADFAHAYGQTTQRLHDDVVALGRLTQATGAEYDAVEAAAAQVDLAERPQAPPSQPGSTPFGPSGPFGPIGPELFGSQGGSDG
jgi:hypothetical protein